jgi:FlaA1/EpsC-like NDP-sugar epimerase
VVIVPCPRIGGDGLVHCGTVVRPDASQRARDLLVRFHPLATPLRALLDMAAWALASWFAIYIRLDFNVSETYRRGYLRTVVIAAIVQALVGFTTGLYRRRWLYGSFDEMRALLATAILTTAILFGLNWYVLDRIVPASTILVGGAIGLMLMVGIRFWWRLLVERLKRPSADASERMLVYGAGEGGLQAITAMMRNPASPYLPVGILDDEPSRQRLSIMGVPSMGGRDRLADAARRTNATSMLIAVPTASSEVVRELVDLADGVGLNVKILPPVDELFSGPVTVGDIREVSDEDLLGRHRIETDVESIAQYLTGRRVLVTGAGGSIGSELCRQIYRFGPSELIMLDRDESALHQVELSIHGRALLDSDETVLVDIRDAAALEDVFARRRPEVVFHAAALKHLPMLERFPLEGFKSNVLGTLNVLRASRSVGVSVFVNISTDKAANPTSVLGYSKRIAERLTAHEGETGSGEYLSVRFGNVLGSRGSVLTSFHEQIARGGPVTVTHPDVTRYFMTIPEAVQLVIQAGAIGRRGEVLVLDMGEPVRIHDLAKQLITRSGKNVSIVFTGLREGEKLHEELFSTGDLDHRPRHPLISHARVQPLDPATLPPTEASVAELFAEGVR